MKNTRKIIILVLLVGLIYLIFTNYRTSPFPKEAKSVVVKNGNTGVERILNDSEKTSLLEKANALEYKITGIKLPSSGYTYKINIDGQDIILYGDNILSSGMFKYKCEGDLIGLVE